MLMPVYEMHKVGFDGVNGVVVFTFLGGIREGDTRVSVASHQKPLPNGSTAVKG
jgi:hypothetical protein